MTILALDYGTPSALAATDGHDTLALTPNTRRPVRFLGRVKEQGFPLRLALQALGRLIWSDDTWQSSADYQAFTLDPIVTAHPDRVFFEAFSRDRSAYGLAIADMTLFETEGEMHYGTTNVDFTAWLFSALGEMRSSRETWLRIDPGGFEVATVGAGGRYEAKVDVPDDWARGFLQLQGAMAMPGTRVVARPVDLLAAIRYLEAVKAKGSPRALRHEFPPGEDARIVLEPWEHVIRLKGATHHYDDPRTIRTWGRRRLRLIEPLLPYADSVEIFLKGRALPSFYAVKLGGVTFVLGLSGWTENRWTGTGSFDLLGSASADPHDEINIPRALDALRESYNLRADVLQLKLGVDRAAADRLLTRLCRRGQAIFDVERREYRLRELFDAPADEARLFPPDPRAESARGLLDRGTVSVETALPRETRKIRRLKTPEGPVEREVVYRDWQVNGSAGDQPAVEIVVNDSGRILFGTCGCAFFDENVLNRGPCEHMIALLAASESARKDAPAP